MSYNSGKFKLTFNSPVVLSFALACFIVLILDIVTGSASTKSLFSVYRSSLLSPLTYIRFFGHVLGHSGWPHFFGNMMMFLVIGPLLEAKYGSRNLLSVILITAFVTGLIHFVFFPYARLLGASGVVFAFILLASITSYQDGEIPITFVLVAVIYISQQVYSAFFVKDNVSNLTHIIGGFVGSGLGYYMNKNKLNRY